MKLGEAIEDVEAAETSLAKELLKIGQRHAAEQDVYHVCHTLAKRCDEQLALLTLHRKRYGAHVGQKVGEPAPGVERVRRMSWKQLAGQQPSGALLLRDLKELAGVVQHAELEWVVLLQAANAARDQQLKTAAEKVASTQRHAESGFARESRSSRRRFSSRGNRNGQHRAAATPCTVRCLTGQAKRGLVLPVGL